MTTPPRPSTAVPENTRQDFVARAHTSSAVEPVAPLPQSSPGHISALPEGSSRIDQREPARVDAAPPVAYAPLPRRTMVERTRAALDQDAATTGAWQLPAGRRPGEMRRRCSDERNRAALEGDAALLRGDSMNWGEREQTSRRALSASTYEAIQEHEAIQTRSAAVVASRHATHTNELVRELSFDLSKCVDQIHAMRSEHAELVNKLRLSGSDE